MKTDIEAVEIRPMATADLAQVLGLAEALPEAPHWPQSAYLKALNSQIDPNSTPHRIALVAAGTKPGSVLGFTVASLLPPQAELETMAVVREGQRRGIGRQLIHALIHELKTAGAQELLLEVRASNHPARAFYRSLGFVQTGRRSGYYADPVEDAVQMRLPLA